MWIVGIGGFIGSGRRLVKEFSKGRREREREVVRLDLMVMKF